MKPQPAGPECDSGVIAPDGLLDDEWAYGITGCGFVARAPRDATLQGKSTELRDEMDAHYQAVHPKKWREIVIGRAISAD